MFKLLFLIFPLVIFSQIEINVSFNKTSIIYNEGSQKLDTLNVLYANIKTKYGKFTLQLIDCNKNNIYNDYGNKNEYIPYTKLISQRPDGLFISEYKNPVTHKLFDGSIKTLLNSNIIVFNGHFFRLYGLKKNIRNEYVGKLRIIKKEVNYFDAYKNNYLTFIDRLPNICVFRLNDNKKIRLNEYLNNEYLYIKFIGANVNFTSPSSVNINYMESYDLFEKIKIIYLIVDSNNDMILNFNTVKKLKHDSFYINKNDYKKMLTLGCNMYPLGILFNKKGELIENYIEPYNLKKYEK